MSGMLAELCSHYYKLMLKVEKRDERYQQLIENDLTFDLKMTVDELDVIIDHRLKITKAHEHYQVAFEKWKETGQKILAIFKHFDIRPRWTLKGEIPGEAVYWVWYDLKNNVHIMKVEDLETGTDDLDPNTLYIPLPDLEAIEDEDEFERAEREQYEAERNRRYEIHNQSVGNAKPKLIQSYEELTDDDD